MIVFISDKFSKKIKFVAYYQIIGGAIGLLLTLWVMVNSEGGGLLLLLGTLGLYTFSMYCGKMLLDGKVKDGLRFSTIIQVIQTINFALLGYAFKFIAGLNLTVGINYTTDLKFIYNISLSQFMININSQKDLVVVGINLIALSMIFIIGNLMIEYQEESNKKQNNPENIMI
jgi:hypothetical protein